MQVGAWKSCVDETFFFMQTGFYLCKDISLFCDLRGEKLKKLSDLFKSYVLFCALLASSGQIKNLLDLKNVRYVIWNDDFEGCLSILFPKLLSFIKNVFVKVNVTS